MKNPETYHQTIAPAETENYTDRFKRTIHNLSSRALGCKQTLSEQYKLDTTDYDEVEEPEIVRAYD